MPSQAKQCLEAAQQRQKAYADRTRTQVQLQVGQKVLLSTKNITLKMVGAAKLMPKFVGPFKILEQINEVAYRLELPPSMPIHNVFHVSLLKPYHDDGKRQPPPPPALVDTELEYEVEQILLHRERKIGKRKVIDYLVKWVGYDVEHNTWEPDHNCVNCPDKVQQYWNAVTARKAVAQTRRNK